uniref:Piwi-like protein n=1 Tax=Halisarca dujardinii TaxID=2583056 RepID=A0A3G6V6F4_HALDU|nr:piwi-like protein [Halisarca dujardinii]
MSSSGFGRGGRGAALRQALEQPVRKPGEQQQPPPAQQTPGAPNSAQPQQQLPGRGRAGLLQLLQQHAQQGAQAQPPPPDPRPGQVPTAAAQPRPQAAPFGVQQQPRPVTQSSPTGRSTHLPTPEQHPSLVSPAGGLTRPPALPSSQPTVPQPLPSQPGAPAPRGTAGAPLRLKANYLKLVLTNDAVYQYAVTFKPVIESNNVRFALLSQMKDIMGETRAFDGATLYLPIKITDSAVERSVLCSRDGSNVLVRVELVKILLYEDCLHLLNLIFKRAMRRLNLKQVGKNTYDPSNSVRIPQHKLELWPGYITAITRKENDLWLMLDVSHRVLRDETALEFFYSLYEQSAATFQTEATRQLLGSVVLTRYNNKTYRVDDIAWDKNPESTFIDSTGKPVQFLQYYKTRYNLTISDHEQPLLIHRERKKERGQKKEDREESIICLIPELCSLTGLTDVARNDFRLMKDLAVYTKITPAQRNNAFTKFMNSLTTNPEALKELTTWGLGFDRSTVTLEGRQLPPEKILFGNGRTADPGVIADFNRDVGSMSCITPVPLNTWAVLFARKDHNRAFEFINMIKKVCGPLGMDIADPQPCELQDDRTETYLTALRQVINDRQQMVVCIFPTARDDRYSAVKKLCCCDRPVPSQCINSKTLGSAQKLKSVSQKILLQINAKLGGELWAVEIPLKSVMVIGIDVYHERGNKSVAGFVASMNRSMTRWYSRAVFQTQSEELMTGLSECMNKALTKYHQANQQLPERIIVFRDGVGDGQMKFLLEMEVPQMLACFKAFGDEYKPKFAMVVVQKRISTRMFAVRGGDLKNPPPGSVLDHTLTRYAKPGDRYMRA